MTPSDTKLGGDDRRRGRISSAPGLSRRLEEARERVARTRLRRTLGAFSDAEHTDPDRITLPGATGGADGIGDKRGIDRIGVSLPLFMRRAGSNEASEDRCRDLTSTGMFIATGEPLMLGSVIAFECNFGMLRRFGGMARVVWARNVTNGFGPRGVGVCFLDLDANGLEAIEFIMTYAGEHPDEPDRPVATVTLTPQPFAAFDADESRAVVVDPSTAPMPSVIVEQAAQWVATTATTAPMVDRSAAVEKARTIEFKRSTPVMLEAKATTSAGNYSVQEGETTVIRSSTPPDRSTIRGHQSQYSEHSQHRSRPSPAPEVRAPSVSAAAPTHIVGEATPAPASGSLSATIIGPPPMESSSNTAVAEQVSSVAADVDREAAAPPRPARILHAVQSIPVVDGHSDVDESRDTTPVDSGEVEAQTLTTGDGSGRLAVGDEGDPRWRRQRLAELVADQERRESYASDDRDDAGKARRSSHAFGLGSAALIDFADKFRRPLSVLALLIAVGLAVYFATRAPAPATTPPDVQRAAQ